MYKNTDTDCHFKSIHQSISILYIFCYTVCLSPQKPDDREWKCQTEVLRWKFTGQTHLDIPGTVVSDDLVCDPVEDVKDEESQRERRSSYGVNPLCSVDKLASVCFCVLQDRRRVDAVHRGAFDRITIFNTWCHVVGREVQTSVL